MKPILHSASPRSKDLESQIAEFFQSGVQYIADGVSAEVPKVDAKGRININLRNVKKEAGVNE